MRINQIELSTRSNFSPINRKPINKFIFSWPQARIKKTARQKNSNDRFNAQFYHFHIHMALASHKFIYWQIISER